MLKYIPSFIPNKVLIIGAGGTGSRLVPLLGQFLKTCAWIANPEITLVDDDIVEEKNLLRQNFISPDVGKHKAEVLAQRYSRAFDIPIVPKVLRITKPGALSSDVHANSEQQKIFQAYSKNSIIVMCVDSPEARRHIIGRLVEACGSRLDPSMLVIDSGNENDFGQITVSTFAQSYPSYEEPTLRHLPNNLPTEVDIPHIPFDLSYFENMTAVSGGSCADLDQTMAINTMMAVTMFGVIQNFYYAKPITFHRLNVTLADGITPEYINAAYLLKCKSSTPTTRSLFTDYYRLDIPYFDVQAIVRAMNKDNVLLSTHKRDAEKTEQKRKEVELEQLVMQRVSERLKQMEGDKKTFTMPTMETGDGPSVAATDLMRSAMLAVAMGAEVYPSKKKPTRSTTNVL